MGLVWWLMIVLFFYSPGANNCLANNSFSLIIERWILSNSISFFCQRYFILLARGLILERAKLPLMIADSLSMRERKSSMIDTIRPAHRCRRQQNRWRLNGLAMEINLPAHSRRSHSTRASDVKAIHIASFPINIDCWLVVHSSQITFTFKFSVSLSICVTLVQWKERWFIVTWSLISLSQRLNKSKHELLKSIEA